MGRIRKPKDHYTAIRGSGARAVYAHHSGAMHNLEFTFVTPENENFTVTMDHANAREFLNSAIAAYQATMEPLRIARDIPFAG